MKIVPRKRKGTKWLDKDESKQKSDFRTKIRTSDKDNEGKITKATKKMEKGAK